MVAGRLLLRPVLRAVAAARTPELFTGITLFLALGVSWATALAGLSMALGAFLAGLLISETEYRHQVEADIAPFRGLLLALFFMAIGMGIDVRHAGRQLAVVAARRGGGAGGEGGRRRGAGAGVRAAVGDGGVPGIRPVAGGRVRLRPRHPGDEAGALPAETGGLAMLVVAISIAATPLLMRAGHAAARRVHRVADAEAELGSDARDLRRHALILGLGRVGRTVVQLLKTTEREYVALDRDPEAVAEGRARGIVGVLRRRQPTRRCCARPGWGARPSSSSPWTTRRRPRARCTPSARRTTTCP